MLEDGWSQHILLVVSIEKDIVEHSKYPIDWHRPEVEAGESCKTACENEIKFKLVPCEQFNAGPYWSFL